MLTTTGNENLDRAMPSASSSSDLDIKLLFDRITTLVTENAASQATWSKKTTGSRRLKNSLRKRGNDLLIGRVSRSPMQGLLRVQNVHRQVLSWTCFASR